MSNFVIRNLASRKKETGFINIPVSQITAEGDVGSITIRFDPAPTGVTVRELQVSSDGVVFTTLASSLQGNLNLYDTAYEHRGLLNDVTRYYRLRNGISGASVTWGSFSGIRNAKTKKIPTANNGFGSARLVSAEIDGTSGRTDEIILTFDENVIIPNVQGWHLAGGPCQIKSYHSGNGTNRVVCKLTDFVIPDHNYKVIHRREISGATCTTGKLNNQGYIDVTKTNVIQYLGTGTIYYVSENGNDGNSGRTTTAPKRNPDAAMSLAQAGDYVLLRCDHKWITNPRFARNGTSTKYIWISYYDSGALPIVEARDPAQGDPWNNKPVFEFTREYNGVCGIHAIVKGGGACIDYKGSKHCITKGCRVRGNATLGINPCSRHTGTTNPIVLDNDVEGFWANIRSSGYPLATSNGQTTGTKLHQCYGGLIEGNKAPNTSGDDCFALQRGDYHNIILRYNQGWDYDDDWGDFFAADNVICEYNTVGNPRNSAANGIKAGGITRADNVPNVQGDNVIVRYNKIVDITTNDDSWNAINTNDGRSGQVYGNFICNVPGVGIKMSGNVSEWRIYNNTVINATRGFESWNLSGNTNNVFILNNIFDGSKSFGGSNFDIVATNPSGGNHVGRNNILINGTRSGAYSGNNDVVGTDENALFVSYTGNGTGDYRLKEGSIAVDYGIDIDGYNKDSQGLPITNGIDCGCFERAAAETVENTTFWYCGDSMTDNDTPGQDGFAEQIAQYFGQYVAHRNEGDNGESTQSFRDDFWPNFESQILAGHYVFFAFGHNDRWSSTKGTSEAQFQTNLEWFIDEVKSKSAIPVLCTPFERRQFSGATVDDSHGNYDNIVRTVASNEGVILLDLQARTKEVFEGIGQAKADHYWGDPARSTDRTHASTDNAFRLSLTVVHEIVRQDLYIANYLLAEHKDFDLSTLVYPDL